MRFRRLHDDLGVEVLDFEVRTTPSPEEVETLRRALDEHLLLLFRGGQEISPEHQIEISKWFGSPVEHAGDERMWSVLSNDEAGGGRRRLPFHSDLTYTDCPMKVISLQAIALPPLGSTTLFVSAVRGWSTLSPERQDRLAPLTLRHHYFPENPEWPEFIADHPVKFLHPRTGQPVLLVTEHHAERIPEVDEEESELLITELLAHLYAPERIYAHAWQIHDLIIWDNLAVQHARPDEANPADGPRKLQRVAMSEVPFGELIIHAREQQAVREHEDNAPAAIRSREPRRGTYSAHPRVT
jgi:alpha-ketoglutarate-dependent taurine dioxygenase